MKTRSVTACLAFVAAFSASCRKDKPQSDASPEEMAELTFLFSPAEGLTGQPNIYEMKVTPTTGAQPLVRAGDLPAPNQTISLGNLPAAAAATLAGGLYRDAIADASQTHSCRAEAPFALVGGQTATIAVVCTEVGNASGAPGVKVFAKVAKASLKVETRDADPILAARDWSAPLLFAATDTNGKRVTLKQNAHGLTVHIGGDLTYVTSEIALPALLEGKTITLEAIAGTLLPTAPEAATLKLSERPLFYEEDNGDLIVLLALDLANATGTITAKGRLAEEPVGSEFTIVGYNVENLFDQTDELRNEGYGDYRIAANGAGNTSNYGEPVDLGNGPVTWTDAKIAGIRKTLVALDPAGPEIIGLTEIESAAALERLRLAVADLGYQTAQFSQWTPGMTETAIGMGILSKYLLKEWSLLAPVMPAVPDGQPAPEAARPILKATLDVNGHPLIVYVNHWKSKGGPESQRKAYAEALQADIAAVTAIDARADYVILGDLNSEYNETVVIEPGHNDTDRVTGINHVLKAQGDELDVLTMRTAGYKYNLHYELDRAARKTAWHTGHEWSSLDHMIVGAGVYDRKGVTYVDNSFSPVTFAMPRTKHLFSPDGKQTNRWKQKRQGKHTTHELGGYSDHLPLVARFHVATRQSPGTIWLGTPGKPDKTDPKP